MRGNFLTQDESDDYEDYDFDDSENTGYGSTLSDDEDDDYDDDKYLGRSGGE